MDIRGEMRVYADAKKSNPPSSEGAGAGAGGSSHASNVSTAGAGVDAGFAIQRSSLVDRGFCDGGDN